MQKINEIKRLLQINKDSPQESTIKSKEELTPKFVKGSELTGFDCLACNQVVVPDKLENLSKIKDP